MKFMFSAGMFSSFSTVTPTRKSYSFLYPPENILFTEIYLLKNYCRDTLQKGIQDRGVICIMKYMTTVFVESQKWYSAQLCMSFHNPTLHFLRSKKKSLQTSSVNKCS